MLEEAALATEPKKLTAREEAPALTEGLQEQSIVLKCCAAAKLVGLPTSNLHYDRDEVHMGQCPVDPALRKVVPVSLSSRILYLSRYPTFARYRRGR